MTEKNRPWWVGAGAKGAKAWAAGLLAVLVATSGMGGVANAATGDGALPPAPVEQEAGATAPAPEEEAEQQEGAEEEAAQPEPPPEEEGVEYAVPAPSPAPQSLSRSLPAPKAAPVLTDAEQLQQLFAKAKAGSTVKVPARTYELGNVVIELPTAKNVTVDAKGATFKRVSGTPAFYGAFTEGMKWTGGTFVSNGNARIGFSLFQAKGISFTDMLFDRAINIGNHAFDLQAVDGAVFDRVTFQGYGNTADLAAIKARTGANPHDFYSEAIQLDYLYETGAGARGWKFYTERGGVKNTMQTRNVTVKNSVFIPSYDKNGKMTSWAPPPVGQHAHNTASRNEGIVFEGNTVIDPIPGDGTDYPGALHFAPAANVTIKSNTFQSSVPRAAWVSVTSRDAVKQKTEGITVSGNVFTGVQPTTVYAVATVLAGTSTGVLIDGVSVTGNTWVTGNTAPATAKLGNVPRIGSVTESGNTAPAAIASLALTGTLQVGSTVTAKPGAVAPADAVLTYQWLRDGKAITGATAASYKLVAADAGKTVSVTATAKKPGYVNATASAAAATKVAATDFEQLKQLFAQAKPGSTITLPAKTYVLNGGTMELPHGKNITVDATNAKFTGSVQFVSARTDGFTWKGGTFSGGGTKRLIFGLMGITNAKFSDMVFDRAVNMSNHGFDVMASKNVVFDRLTFIGYGNTVDLTGLSLHNYYSEAIQLDQLVDGSVGSGGLNNAANKIYFARGGQWTKYQSSGITVQNSVFKPAYDANGKMIAWAQNPIGQHTSGATTRNENIVFRNNTVIDPVPAPQLSLDRFDGALHFTPAANVVIEGNTFQSSVPRRTWIQVANSTKAPATVTSNVKVLKNTFTGVQPTVGYVALDAHHPSPQAVITGITVSDNVLVKGSTAPVVKVRGNTKQVTNVVQGCNVPQGAKCSVPAAVQKKINGTIDFNLDGKADLIAKDKSGRLWLYPGTGKGSQSSRIQIGTGWSSYRVVTASDVNGDGKVDVIAAGSDGKLWLYRGNGKNGFTARTEISYGYNAIRDLVSPGDVNGDGVGDFMGVRNATGQLTVWTMKKDGKIAKRTEIATGWKGMTLAGGADFDGDGKTDILAKDAAGKLWLYPGNGKGDFPAGSRKLIGSSGWGPYTVTSVGDYNGDSIADVIARDTRDGRLYTYPGKKGGSLGARVQSGTGWNSMAQIG